MVSGQRAFPCAGCALLQRTAPPTGARVICSYGSRCVFLEKSIRRCCRDRFSRRVGLFPGRKRVLPHGRGRVSAATLGAALILDATRRCRPFVAGAAFHPVGQLADVPGRAVHSVPERRVRQFLASHVKIVSLSKFRKQAILVEGRYWVSLAIGLPRLLATMVSTFHLSSARSGTRCST